MILQNKSPRKKKSVSGNRLPLKIKVDPKHYVKAKCIHLKIFI